LLRFGSAVETGRHHSVADWNALLEQHLTETMDALAHDAIERDPGLFRLLLRGRAGVGGIYDVWRRMVAVAGLRRAHLSHDPEG
jgi:hypothetical protein